MIKNLKENYLNSKLQFTSSKTGTKNHKNIKDENNHF